jgi:phosphopantetheinyl transferase
VPGSTSSDVLAPPIPYDVELSGRVARLRPGRPSGDSVEQLEELADLTLASAEHEMWRRRASTPRRRGQWLLGRIAAKDAVRQLVLDRTGQALERSEVSILCGPLGGPSATIRDGATGSRRVLVSIAHTDAVAVAIACADLRIQGIGIDVERHRASPAIERIGLNTRERSELAGLSADARADRSMRLWCAKEATAKALGTGLSRLGGPRLMTVRPLDEHGSRMLVRVAAPLPVGDRRIDAATRREGDLVLATAVDRRPSTVH